MTYFHDPHKKLYFPIAHPLGRKGGIFLRHQLLPFGFKKIPKAKNGLLWINKTVSVDVMCGYDFDVKSHAEHKNKILSQRKMFPCRDNRKKPKKSSIFLCFSPFKNFLPVQKL